MNKNYCKKQKTDLIIVIEKNPAEYYIEDREVLKEHVKNKQRNLSEEEKEAKQRI